MTCTVKWVAGHAFIQKEPPCEQMDDAAGYICMLGLDCVFRNVGDADSVARIISRYQSFKVQYLGISAIRRRLGIRSCTGDWLDTAEETRAGQAMTLVGHAPYGMKWAFKPKTFLAVLSACVVRAGVGALFAGPSLWLIGSKRGSVN